MEQDDRVVPQQEVMITATAPVSYNMPKTVRQIVAPQPFSSAPQHSNSANGPLMTHYGGGHQQQFHGPDVMPMLGYQSQPQLQSFANFSQDSLDFRQQEVPRYVVDDMHIGVGQRPNQYVTNAYADGRQVHYPIGRYGASQLPPSQFDVNEAVVYTPAAAPSQSYVGSTAAPLSVWGYPPAPSQEQGTAYMPSHAVHSHCSHICVTHTMTPPIYDGSSGVSYINQPVYGGVPPSPRDVYLRRNSQPCARCIAVQQQQQQQQQQRHQQQQQHQLQHHQSLAYLPADYSMGKQFCAEHYVPQYMSSIPPAPVLTSSSHVAPGVQSSILNVDAQHTSNVTAASSAPLEAVSLPPTSGDPVLWSAESETNLQSKTTEVQQSPPKSSSENNIASNVMSEQKLVDVQQQPAVVPIGDSTVSKDADETQQVPLTSQSAQPKRKGRPS